MFDFTWIITVASIIGVIANIYKRWWCFAIWLVTNASWMIIDYIHGIYSQSVLFAIYTMLAVFGLYQWRRGAK